MKLKLEQLEYQKKAIESVISIFKGQYKNSFDNACINGIRSNMLSLPDEDIKKNIENILKKNGIDQTAANISDYKNICIEMETGTGKTLVYIKTIFELFKNYGFTKFIILVPSVAIKEGVLKSCETFKKQLEDIYNIQPNFFEYQSKRLSNVKSFIEEQHPQVMIITLQSFNTDDRILAQEKREDLFFNDSYINSIAKTNPIIIMDEPQEGMDTENSVKRIKQLNPLIKIRYSATHKIVKNLIYRLTPFDSYKQRMVKKIEVLTVSEKNDEASSKIELFKMEFGKGDPKAILKAWHKQAAGFKFKNTKKLNKNDNLQEITNNIIYKDYIIDQIAKPIRKKGFVKFKNGAIIYEKEQAKDYTGIFNEQLYWLIDSHFKKKEKLKSKQIKPLSLIFIDRVNNYINPDGIIKKAFENQYKKVFFNLYKKEPTKEEIEQVQGYYFAKTGKGDYTDNSRSMTTNKQLYNLILKDKEKLLSYKNPVEFIFSHSALGVGWDNPNVFSIATLNQSYSEIKKRQEIGRGLRIAVNQQGERVYDTPNTKEGNEINLLTVIPNETYETFVAQYQSEIAEIYGNQEAGAKIRHTHKGENIGKKRINRNEKLFNGKSFKNFWKKLSKKTDYIVSFDENNLIENSANALNEIIIEDHIIQTSLNRITAISETKISAQHLGSEDKKIKTDYLKLDIIKEISKKTEVAYPAVFKIISKIKNKKEILKNPPYFIYEAAKKIKQIELDEMARGLQYTINGETFNLENFQPYIETYADKTEPTPDRGIYDCTVCDSEIEKNFANKAEKDPEIVCFLKLPPFYVIQTPAGKYNPDFGIVIKKRKIREKNGEDFYFVIETKGTNDINNKKSLTENEIYKIKCAKKHFEALGIESKIKYIAPVKEYETFKRGI